MPKQANTKPEPTTAQRLASVVKSARDIMRKDKGLNGDLDRLPMLAWIMFLKFLDDMEQARETDDFLKGARFRPIIEPPYRWRDWAAQEEGIKGDELIAFVNNDEAVLPDGTRGPGLLTYLRTLQSDNPRDRRAVIANVFKDTRNRMVSGYLLRDVVNKINSIHFTSSAEIHTLSALYESMLKELRDAAGDSGEIYTPRPVVRFMTAVTDPRLGETVLDPACGTGGFLVEAYTHLEQQVQSVEDRQVLQERSLYGGEAKSLPYLLAQMNLLLHGLEYPEIDYGNSLEKKLSEMSDRDRVDVILTNPPFGGEEEAGIQGNFPQDKRTSETALLFLQLIMRKLRRATSPPAPLLRGEGRQGGGRAAVVVPNGTLFGDGVAARIKEEMLKEFNLHTIVRLPNGVFAPYTSIPTNLLFFDRSGPTGDIWYYEMPLPEGRKQYTKTRPMQFEEFGPILDWWNRREENDCAWRVDFRAKYDDVIAQATPHWDAAREAEGMAAALDAEVKLVDAQLRGGNGGLPAKDSGMKPEQRRALGKQREQLFTEAAAERQRAKAEQAAGDAIYWPIYNLDIKNPNAAGDLEHLPPAQLAADILEKERRIIALIEEIKAELESSG